MAVSPLAPGGTISHYRILELIGGGGMGVVYKAVSVPRLCQCRGTGKG